MKAAIVLAQGIKQVMLTAESDEEKAILNCFKPSESIQLEIKKGTFYDHTPESAQGYTVMECKGGYLRSFESSESIMLVLRPEKAEHNG
jgi:hypothetical protein